MNREKFAVGVGIAVFLYCARGAFLQRVFHTSSGPLERVLAVKGQGVTAQSASTGRGV
jgi:hypothetical protein